MLGGVPAPGRGRGAGQGGGAGGGRGGRLPLGSGSSSLLVPRSSFLALAGLTRFSRPVLPPPPAGAHSETDSERDREKYYTYPAPRLIHSGAALSIYRRHHGVGRRAAPRAATAHPGCPWGRRGAGDGAARSAAAVAGGMDGGRPSDRDRRFHSRGGFNIGMQ